MKLEFRFISDDGSGESLPRVFDHYWPAYQRWIRRSESTTSAAQCARQLRHHMPELAPLFDELLERVRGDNEVARFLALYDPPRVVRACSQLAFDAATGPTLIRAYDHHPKRFDALVLASRWNGTSTLALTDCLWGALDGMNEHGCVVALAFGGRNVIGPGFGPSLILRYLLQTCATVDDVREALARLPVYMPYTIAALDASGEFVTAYVGPDRPASFVARRASSNHQGAVEWSAYARHTETVRRLETIESLLDEASDVDRIHEAFLSPPLWRTDYARGSGTLYVAEYAPVNHTLTLRWPGRRESFHLSDQHDRAFAIALSSESSRQLH